MRAIKDAFIGMKDVLTRGWKHVGKRLLTSYRGHLEDVGQSHRLDMIMTRAGIPTYIDSIHTDDEPDDLPPSETMVFSDAEWTAFYDGNILFFFINDIFILSFICKKYIT
jgi:hypothetical protein